MARYDVTNMRTSHSFGAYEAETADEAIEACIRDAGYDDKADSESVVGHEIDFVATEIRE